MKSLRIYLELVRYLAPYRARLIVGIIAGFLSGGSLFGVLHFSEDLIKPFETSATDHSDDASDSVDADSEPGVVERVAAYFDIPVIEASGAMTWQFIVISAVVIVMFVFLKSVANYVNRYCMRWVGGRVITDLRNDIFSSLQRQSLAFYSQKDIGQLIGRCVNDTASVQGAVSNSVEDLTRAPMELVAAVIFIIAFSIRNEIYALPLVMFLVMPLTILPIAILGRRIRQYTKRSLSRVSDLISRMYENFTGIRAVKAFHTEAEEERRFHALSHQYFRLVIKALRAELLMTPLMEFVSVLCICGFLVYCYVGGFSLSQIVPMAGAAGLAYSPIKRLVKVYSYLQRSIAAAERIFELLQIDTSIPEADPPVRKHAFDTGVRFNNVGFDYGDNTAFAVKQVSFEIGKGHLIAFVGETGSGKSTIANLLARFYDPTSGSVTMDGIDMRSIKIADLRSLIGVVTQETVIFNTTIRQNIIYGSPDATDEQVENAARLANIHEFIVSNPDGYEHRVGDKGFKLSGGEKQRLAIARVVLRNPEILILDEATSALDTVTEQMITEALDRLMKNRTVFAIAHRLSTVKNAHRIFVMDSGAIVESGTHADLLAQDGRYKQLYDKQFD